MIIREVNSPPWLPGSSNAWALHLPLDNIIYSQTDLSTAWIYYKKAYDSMSHTLALECLALDKRTEYSDNPHQDLIVALENKSGSLLQGHRTNHHLVQDIPKWWTALSLSPLNKIIRKSGCGHRFRSGVTIRHHLCMDYIKLFSKKGDTDLLIHLQWRNWDFFLTGQIWLDGGKVWEGGQMWQKCILVPLWPWCPKWPCP